MTNDPLQQSNSTFEDELSISEYLGILLDEWRTILVPFLLVILLAGGYMLITVPSYLAQGVIQVSIGDTSSANALSELTGLGRPSPVETEIEIIRSRYIVGKAAQKLGLSLSQKNPDITLNLGVSLGGKSPLDLNLVALRKQVTDVKVEDWVEQIFDSVFKVSKGGDLLFTLGNFKQVQIAPGESYTDHGVSFIWTGPGKIDRDIPIKVQIIPDDKLAADVIESISIEGVGGRKETNLVRISSEQIDRTLARDLVNNIMETYMNFTLEWRTMRADRSATFIQGQLDAIRITLENSETDLQTFLEESGAILLPEQAKELIKGGAELELELRKVRIQTELLSMVSAEIARATKKNKPVSLTGDFLFDDELMGQAVGALNELQRKRETLLSDVTETHPEVLRISEEIRRIRAQLLSLVKASTDRTKERKRSIGRVLDDIQDELAVFPDKERQMASIRRKLAVSQQLYTFLMTKLEETRILRASTTTDKRIIDSATTPFKKNRPRRSTALIIAAFLGLLIGVSAVFLRRAIDPRIRDEEEAKTLSTLSTYGVIPNLKTLGISGERDPVINEIWDAPKGPAAEAFRTLRTNVEFSQVEDNPIKVIQITSSEPSEGKSTVISNLSVALANAGHKVLIVDLDLRKPVQHKIWGVPRSPGISNSLAGRVPIAVHKLEKWNVTVVSAGNEPPESQRLLASKALTELISKWRDQYDYILLDTPPLLVADSLVISRHSDLMLFVVRPKVCRRASIKLAGHTHKKMNLVKGMVINGVASRRGGYYHYYRGSYYGSRTTDTQES